MSKEFDFDREDKLYCDELREESTLVSEKINLGGKLSEINSRLKEINKKTTEQKMRILDCIEILFPPHKQECTCGTELPLELKKYSRYVKCLKHLCRYFNNTGCYWCGYTDCSKWNC